MAKKNKRLFSKKTKKKLKAAAPWALAVAATGGMIAAFADRSIRGKVRNLTERTVEKVQRAKSNGMVGAGVPHESGAV